MGGISSGFGRGGAGTGSGSGATPFLRFLEFVVDEVVAPAEAGLFPLALPMRFELGSSGSFLTGICGSGEGGGSLTLIRGGGEWEG